jgi:hypothetical protein
MRDGHDAANRLNCTRRWCILVPRKVRACVIVTSLVPSQQLAEVLLAEHHDMIEALPSDRADEPLDMSILPGVTPNPSLRPTTSSSTSTLRRPRSTARVCILPARSTRC